MTYKLTISILDLLFISNLVWCSDQNLRCIRQVSQSNRAFKYGDVHPVRLSVCWHCMMMFNW